MNPTLTLRPFPYRGSQDAEAFNNTARESLRDTAFLAYKMAGRILDGQAIKGQVDYIKDNRDYLLQGTGSRFGTTPSVTVFVSPDESNNLQFTGYSSFISSLKTLEGQAFNMGHSSTRGAI